MMVETWPGQMNQLSAAFPVIKQGGAKVVVNALHEEHVKKTVDEIKNMGYVLFYNFPHFFYQTK